MKGFKQLIIFTIFLSAKLFACTTLNWQSTPTEIVTDGFVAFSNLCVNPVGNGVAAWINGTGIPFVQASSYSSSGTWSAPATLSTGTSAFLDLCCFENGDAIAVWRQDAGGGNYAIWSASYTFGSGWSPATQISGLSPGIEVPQVTCSDALTATAVWNDGNSIDYAHFDGSTWLASGTVYSGGVPQNSVTLCNDGSGNVVAAWIEGAPPGGDIRAATFTPSGTWINSGIISTGLPSDNGLPDVACDSQGNAVAVWNGSVPFGPFYASYYDRSTSSWLGAPVLISGAETNINGIAPDVCMDSDGNALIVFVGTTDGANSEISSVFYDAQTATFGAPVVIGFSNQPTTDPQVCCGPCDSTAIWMQAAGAGALDLKGAIFNGTTHEWVINNPTPILPQTPYEFTIISSTPGQVLEAAPQLSCDGMGNAYVNWTGTDANSNNVLQNVNGYCPPDLLSLWIDGKPKNRFPFQTECYYLLRWAIESCIGGIQGFQIFVDGVLIATVPGNTYSYPLPQGGHTITVRPINILGIVGPGQTITVN